MSQSVTGGGKGTEVYRGFMTVETGSGEGIGGLPSGTYSVSAEGDWVGPVWGPEGVGRGGRPKGYSGDH